MARTVSVILDAKVDAYRRGLADAEAATRKLADQTRKAGAAVEETAARTRKASAAFERMQDTAMNNSKSWDGMTRDIAVGGALLAGAVGLATREYANFDQAMAGVAATGDDARQAIAGLTDAAMQAGRDTAYTAVEAAGAIEELTRAGVASSEILGGGLTGALDLAAAGQIDVAEASGVAATAMTQFKLAGEDIPHLADLLAAGAGKAMGGVSELGQALKQSGLVAGQFGISVEESIGTLSAFAAAGLLGSDAGTSFKSMLLRLANPAQDTAREMERLGIAAYDAQGNFIGIEALAGQLQDRMAGLTQAERDAAMAKIFGNDAIRAANVLYSEGAAGIAAWTAAVNDAGYASEQAAGLLDNLNGDLQILGGSFSVLAIEAGKANNGPLRALVQTTTLLVNALADAPGAAAGLAVAATGLAGLALSAAGLAKGVSIYANFKTNLAELTELHPRVGRTATALGKLGRAAGIVGLAYTGMQLLGVALNQFATAGPGMDETAAALERVASGAQGVAALDELFRDADDPTRELTRGVGDLAGALEYVSNSTFDDELQNFVAGLVGMEGHLAKTEAQLAQLDEGLAAMDGRARQDALGPIIEQMRELGYSADDIRETLPNAFAATEQALVGASNQWQTFATDADSVVRVMAGDLPDGLKMTADGMLTTAAAAGEAADGMSGAVSEAEALAEAALEQADAMRDAADAHMAARDAIVAVNDAQRAAAGLFMSEQAAVDSYIETLQQLTDQIEDNGTSLDENTEKGRANRAYLRDVASAARDVTDAMRDNGASVGEVNGKMAAQRDEFIKLIGSFGVTGDAANAYADDLGLIPNYVETLIATPGAKLSQEEADAVNDALQGLPDDVKADIITVAHRDGYNAAVAMLNDIDGRIANTYIRTIYQRVESVQQSADRVVPGSGFAVRRAGGGQVRGPGTTTSDSILMFASDKEYVIRAAAAEKIGLSRLDYINRYGEIPRFRDGGEIGGRPAGAYATAAPYSGSGTSNVTYVNLEGREAMQWVMANLRDSDRTRYQTEGVHHGV